jgi:hypothetical protein
MYRLLKYVAGIVTKQSAIGGTHTADNTEGKRQTVDLNASMTQEG